MNAIPNMLEVLPWASSRNLGCFSTWPGLTYAASVNVECPLCDGDGCDTCEGTGGVEEGGLVDEVFKDDDAQPDEFPKDDDQDVVEEAQ